MKVIKVYGPGCKRCETTAAMVRDTASRLGIDVVVERVADAKSIVIAGVMSTPGLLVDGRLVHSGRLPDTVKREGWLGA